VFMLFPPRLHAVATTIGGVVAVLAPTVGPVVGGFITATWSWPWLFLINLPIGIAAVIIGWKALPHVRGHGRPLDLVAALLSAAMMGCTVFGAETFARESGTLGISLIAAGIGAGVLLVRREWGEPTPLFPVDLLKIRIFSMSIGTSTVSFAAQMLAYVTLPFLFQSVLGRSAFETGLLMTPWPIAIGIIAPIAGRLADKVRAGLIGGIGLGVMLLVVYPAFAFLSAHPSTTALCIVSALLAVFVSGQIVPVLVMIPELFPKHVRATGIALTYVVSASFFGGFSPFIASWLVARTGNALAPAWYVAAACAISLVPVIWLKDRTGEALA